MLPLCAFMAPMAFIPASSNIFSPSLHHKHIMRTSCAAYFQVAWLDYLCLCVVAGFTLVLYCTPMYYKDYRVVPMLPSITSSNISQPFEQFQLPLGISYPWLKEPLPTYGCAVVVVMVPLLVIGLFQIKTWSLWDFHASFVGVLKAVVSTYVNTFCFPYF
jgi:diacylglycerol diphosphate phosphatase / phosphatidate phosphatase